MLVELLYASARASPDRIAVVYGDERVSYEELVERVERLAHGLAARGVRPGDAVALLMGNTPTFVASFFAITGLGAVVVPLNPQFKQGELESCFRSCRVSAVLANEPSRAVCERLAAASDRPVQIIASGSGVSPERLMRDNGPLALDGRDPDEVLVHMFSSGSTGRPKRLGRTHGQLWAEAAAYAWIRPSDRIFCAVPLFHAYGLGCCLLAAMRNAATLVLMEEPHPFVLTRYRAAALIEREQATVFPGVPFNFRLLADSGARADLSSLRLAFSAGTALPRSTFDAFLASFGVPVRQLYGCTEAGTLTANLDPDPVATRASVGTPVGEVDVAIVDGEVAVASPALTHGYADMESLNREAFRGGRFFTGDLGRLDRDGRLSITGRKKLLIQVSGHKVDPLEVQDVVVAHPGVRTAVVVGVEGSAPGEEQVKAVVVPDGDFNDRELIRFCQERLATFKVPRIVECRDEIPTSPLGKVLRKYLV